MRARLLLFAAASAACSLSAMAGTAHADPIAEAKDLFARGRALREKGDCAGAVSLFRNAFDLYPQGLGSLRNLAECDESLGRFASARRAWLDLGRALLGREDPKYAGWTLDAEQGAARDAPKVGTLTIELAVTNPGGEAAPREGVEVTLNGERISPELLGTPLDEDPGHYRVRTFGRDVRNAPEESFDLGPGETKRVALRVVRAIETARRELVPPNGAVRRTAGWVAIGVGALGVVGTTVSLIVYQTALDDVRGNCTNEGSSYACPASKKETLQHSVDRGNTASVLVDVFGALGAAGLVSGIVLLTPNLWHSSSTAALVVSPMGASAVWRF